MKKNISTSLSLGKRILSLILALFLMQGAVACTKGNDKNKDQQVSSESAEQETDAPTESDPANTDDKSKSESSSQENIGEFNTTDLAGEEVNQEIFKEHKLTMLNVMSSTCGPCMEELPDLAELAEEYQDKDFAIVALNIDMDMEGQPDEKSREAVKKVLEGKGEQLKVIFLDDNLSTKILPKTQFIPYTCFVDSEGNIVGDEYVGALSKADWQEVIDNELAKLGS